MFEAIAKERGRTRKQRGKVKKINKRESIGVASTNYAARVVAMLLERLRDLYNSGGVGDTRKRRNWSQKAFMNHLKYT